MMKENTFTISVNSTAPGVGARSETKIIDAHIPGHWEALGALGGIAGVGQQCTLRGMMGNAGMAGMAGHGGRWGRPRLVASSPRRRHAASEDQCCQRNND